MNSYFKRILLYSVGILVLCCGIVLNTKTGLGVAATNVIPFVCAAGEILTLGNATFVFYCVLILIQCCLQRKLTMKTVLQLPMSLVFGKLVDFFNTTVFTFKITSFTSGIVLLLVAIVLVAIGTTLIVNQRLVPVAPDGCVQSLSESMNLPFGKIKIIYDVTCVCLAIVFSLCVLQRIEGIGIGTVFSMLLTGTCCGFFKRIYSKLNMEEK